MRYAAAVRIRIVSGWGADYTIAKDHQLSFVYNGNYTTSHNRMNINGSQQSATVSNSTDWLHNGRLDYSTPFGMKPVWSSRTTVLRPTSC